MIKIIDDWYITVESNPINYTVRHGEGEKDKNGKAKKKKSGSYAGTSWRLPHQQGNAV